MRLHTVVRLHTEGRLSEGIYLVPEDYVNAFAHFLNVRCERWFVEGYSSLLHHGTIKGRFWITNFARVSTTHCECICTHCSNPKPNPPPLLIYLLYSLHLEEGNKGSSRIPNHARRPSTKQVYCSSLPTGTIGVKTGARAL